MWKGVLYSVIAIITYYLIISGFSSLFEFIFTTEKFSEINDSYLLFIDSIIYLVFICLAIIFIKKFKKVNINTSKITLNFIFKLLFFVLVFRLMEDPLLNINIILGREAIPVNESQNPTTIIEMISTISGIVLLGPIFEELFFRKIILNFFETKYLSVGIIVSSLLFALIHLNTSSLNYISVLLSFVFGIIACLIYLKKGLFYTILFHIAYNFLWVVLKEFRFEYWSILKKLDFGIIYWVLVILSFGVVFYFSLKNIKQLFLYKKG
jgi:membrane protease YdiL (CAAX protease family)